MQKLDKLENKIKAGKVKNASKQIQKLITKVNHNGKNLRKITDDERSQLVKMLSNLVDNLL
jgi:ethanolamine utilization protein EutA (predicted chaperonin)